MSGDKALSVKEHEEEWDEILYNLQELLIFLHSRRPSCGYHSARDYLLVNKNWLINIWHGAGQ